jgi:hypothetical protein
MGPIQNRHIQVVVELEICMPVLLTVVELILMFLRRNPSVLFAFVVMLFIWLPVSHLRSDCIVTPRYLALSACSSWCPCRVYEYFIGVLFHVMDSTLHLSGWKTILKT